MTKTCPGCSVTKPLKEFSRDNTRKDGRQCYCKICSNEHRRGHREKLQELPKPSFCNKCGELLVLGVNWTEGNAKGRSYICRTCRAVQGRAWRKANPEKARATDKRKQKKHSERIAAYQKKWRRANEKKVASQILFRTYGVTLADYNVMLEVQEGGCSICGKTPGENGKRLSVDHDHETGEVRGLLCNNCNQALGGLQDSSELCHQAMLYLQRYGK